MKGHGKPKLTACRIAMSQCFAAIMVKDIVISKLGDHSSEKKAALVTLANRCYRGQDWTSDDKILSGPCVTPKGHDEYFASAQSSSPLSMHALWGYSTKLFVDLFRDLPATGVCLPYIPTCKVAGSAAS